jgi:hypothetical protein
MGGDGSNLLLESFFEHVGVMKLGKYNIPNIQFFI